MKYAKDTIGYWLSKLPEGEREKALRYAKDKKTKWEGLTEKCISTSSAVINAFWWDPTKEGHEYWDAIYERELAKKPKPTRITHTIANPSTFRIDSVNPFTVSWEE